MGLRLRAENHDAARSRSGWESEWRGAPEYGNVRLIGSILDAMQFWMTALSKEKKEKNPQLPEDWDLSIPHTAQRLGPTGHSG